MQALQPQIKEVQERYKGRPQEEMQLEVARLYKEAGVNPLAGCLPTLATLPVWIGLYRCQSSPCLRFQSSMHVLGSINHEHLVLALPRVLRHESQNLGQVHVLLFTLHNGYVSMS